MSGPRSAASGGARACGWTPELSDVAGTLAIVYEREFFFLCIAVAIPPHVVVTVVSPLVAVAIPPRVPVVFSPLVAAVISPHVNDSPYVVV